MENVSFINSITAASPVVCNSADSFLQSAMWGRFKSRFDWTAMAFNVEWAGMGSRPLLALFRHIVPGIGMAYIPWGPELPAAFPRDPRQRANALVELARALRPVLPRTAVFIRFDPPWFAPDGSFPQELPRPFKHAAADIQPPDTVLVDINAPAETILSGMKSKWRYNIGLAEKRGVTVNSGGEEGLDVFYRLFKETAARDGIAIHSIEYYRALFAECQNEDGTLRLFTAAHEGDIVAAIIVLFRGKQATYLYGASANIKRNLMAPYALQWQAMRDARTYGCEVYDLFGIPPDEDPNHPMAGLYRFKTGFGGSIIHRSGSWDFPCRPALYTMFTKAEQLRKNLRNRRKNHGVQR